MTGRVLIAGGGGLIGRALAADLVAAGREVVVLSRSPAAVAPSAGGARTVVWDGRTPAGWQAELEGAAAVVNLAGENVGDGRWTAARKRRLASSRIEPTAAVVAAIAAARRRPAVLLQGSAVGFYGDRGDEPLDERSAAGRGFLPELCVAWEAASELVESLGVRRVLARSAVVLAREGGALPKMARPFRLGLGASLGGGAQRFPWIHLDDEVGALRFLLERADLAGPFNLTAPSTPTNREFSCALARALRRPLWPGVPRPVLGLLLGEMAEVLLASQRVAPARLAEAGFVHRRGELEPALAELLGR